MCRDLIPSQFKEIVDTLPQLAWLHSVRLEECRINAEWASFLGNEGSAMSFGVLTEYIHPEDRTAVLESMKTAISLREAYHICYRLAHRSGHYRNVVTSGFCKTSSETNDPAWLAVTIDLKHHVRSRATEHKIEQRLKALHKTSDTVFWVADKDGEVFEQWGWDSLTSQADREAAGWGWLDAVHPDDKDSLARAWQESVRTSLPFYKEYRLRSRDGTFKWVEGRGTPIWSTSGEVIEWIGTVSDIDERKVKERELATSEERLRLALESTQLGIWDVDFTTGQHSWTNTTREILEIDLNFQINDDTFLNLVHPDDRERVENHFFDSSQNEGTIYSGEYRIITAQTKSVKWISATGRTLTDSQNQPIRKLGTIRDITERINTHIAIKEGEKQLRLALNAARMNAWEIDLETRFVKRSFNTENLLGLSSGSLDAFLENTHPEDQQLVLNFLVHHEPTHQINLRYYHPDGRMLWLGMRGERTEPGRLRGVTFDITAQIQAEQELWRMAHEDNLTGLLNRSAFNNILQKKCTGEKHEDPQFYVVIVDIDNFKEVNDTFGHDAGDILLKRAASRIQAAFKDQESVARIGGDEFAIVFTPIGSDSDLTEMIDRLHRTLRKPITISGRTFSAQSSVGIATFPSDGTTATELMKSADIALYRAKSDGRNRTAYYAPHMRDKIIKRVELFSEFDRALSQRELLVYYQPKIRLDSGQLVGYEALLRWHHPSRGVLTPGVFGMIFENFELSQAVGDLVLEQITDDLCYWHSTGINTGRIAFNLSASDFFADNLSTNILDKLERKSLPPTSIEVEITEDVFLNDSNRNNEFHIKALSESGVTIALDDFGTGFASLTHLKRFPIGNIKIDRSFISNIDTDHRDKSIVSVITNLSKELGIKTTAEGVENINQIKILKEISCTDIQGYFVSPAIHPHKVKEFNFIN